jgi:hypothetical protein
MEWIKKHGWWTAIIVILVIVAIYKREAIMGWFKGGKIAAAATAKKEPDTAGTAS